MKKKDLICRITDLLRDTNVRKPVTVPKQVFHISDDSGNTRNFVIKQTDKSVGFTAEDVCTIIDACMYVIKDAIKKGEDVSVKGFGTLGVHYRKARTTKHPETGENIEVCARYIPKFNFGSELRDCARAYELSITNQTARSDIDFADDDDLTEESDVIV